jgi:putative peptidoglycan lipid II flippase
MIINIAFAVTLPFYTNLGVSGVALAFSIAGFVNAGLLYYYLEKNIGTLDKDNRIFATGIKLVLISLLMGFLVHYSLRFFDIFVDTHTVIGLGLQTLGAIAVGMVTYFGITHTLKIREAGSIFKKSV